VVGHFVFTKELLPLLLSTAKQHPGTTRVVWISSNGHAMAPKEIINFDNVNLTKETGWTRYGQSKAVLPPFTLLRIGRDCSCNSNDTKVFESRSSYILCPSWRHQNRTIASFYSYSRKLPVLPVVSLSGSW
jgi:hypothetical protein